MTMIEEDSDSDTEAASKPSPCKPASSRPLLPAKEEQVTVKQEPLLFSPEHPSLKGAGGPRTPFLGLVGGPGPRPGPSRDTLPGLSSPADRLVKTLQSSAGSPAKMAEQSVLSAFTGTPQLPGGREGVSASVVSSRSLAPAKSDSSNTPDSDEPASKKARKHETIKSSDSSLGGSGSFPFSKLGGSGFTILPVTAASNIMSRSLSSGSQPSSVDRSGLSLNPVTGSSVKLANLPGVSLTSVSRGAGLQSNSLSSRPLMPPPSSVTLSPVPRTNIVTCVNERTTLVPTERFSELSDKKPSPVSSLDSSSSFSSSSKPSLHSPKVQPKQPLLINPVTGQFEVGPTEPVGEPDPDSGDGSTKPTPDPSSGNEDGKSKPKLDSPSGGVSATSGEPSLKLKLKVSLPNNSSKGVKEGLVQSKNHQGKVTEPSEPKLPKLKIKLKDKSVALETDQPTTDHTNSLTSSSEPTCDVTEGPAVQLDLKTRVRIKPLPEKMRILEGTKQDGISSHFPNLNQINHISVDTNPEKKKKTNAKDKKGGKDRLAVWTESLAKHSQREDSGTKETKSWPELLENRLFSQASNSIPPNLSFNKTEVLKNQTDKGKIHI